MFQMRRRFSDRVEDRSAEAMRDTRATLAQVRDRGSEAARFAYDRGSEAARYAYDRSNEAARIAYEYAMNHRKATAAVLLGAGIAAALIWMVRKNGGYAATREKVMERVRRRRQAQANLEAPRIQTPQY